MPFSLAIIFPFFLGIILHIYIIDTFHTIFFSLIPATNSVVGYQGLQANTSRNTMLAPTFLNVGSETGCTLADLTVTGYDAPVWNEDDGELEGGCGGGEFILQFLANNGTITAKYYWIDDGEIAAGWYSSGAGKAIVGGAASVQIPAGTASWLIGKGMTLQSTGQVNPKDLAVKMNSARNTACGNAMPTNLTLADLTVTGYDAPEWIEDDGEYSGGCGGGEFIVQFLQNNGTITAKYYWIDDGEIAPGWYSSGAGKAIAGGAKSVEIPAGKGMWNIGKGMILNFPSPIAD